MIIELPVIINILSPEDKNGKRKLLVKDKVINKLFDLNEIDIEEYIDNKSGKTIKKYTSCYIKEDYFKINRPYTELKDLVINRAYPVKGFMSYSSKYKNK